MCLAATTCAALFFSSCFELQVLHQEAEASVEAVKWTDKGPSFANEKQRTKVGENLGYLLIEDFTYGGGTHQAADWRNAENFSLYDKSFVNKADQSGSFYLSEGIELVNKVTKITFGNNTATTNLICLQIPVLINYNHPVANDNSIHVGLGPYAAIGLGGRIKSGAIKQNIRFGSSKSNDIKRMDYGLAFNAGYRFLKKWDATLQYDLGLRNVSTTPPDPDSHIRGFSLKIGYWFK
jgi:hypothetical protein